MANGINSITGTPEGLAEARRKLEAAADRARRGIAERLAQPHTEGWGLLEEACDFIYLDSQLRGIEGLERAVEKGQDITEAGRTLGRHYQQTVLQRAGQHSSNERANLAETCENLAMKDLAEAFRWAFDKE